jgi:hypothetical protein
MRKKRRIGPTLEREYKRFLELPVPLVLVVLWLTGGGAAGGMRIGALPLRVVAGADVGGL